MTEITRQKQGTFDGEMNRKNVAYRTEKCQACLKKDINNQLNETGISRAVFQNFKISLRMLL